MPLYFIQNNLGEYLTEDTLWSRDKKRALTFNDVRGVMKLCDREHLYDANLTIDFCDARQSNLTVPVREVGPCGDRQIAAKPQVGSRE